jgi:hypothetical protein
MGPEYPQRQLGDRSSPTYKRALDQLDAPRTNLNNKTLLNARRVRFFITCVVGWA